MATVVLVDSLGAETEVSTTRAFVNAVYGRGMMPKTGTIEENYNFLRGAVIPSPNVAGYVKLSELQDPLSPATAAVQERVIDAVEQEFTVEPVGQWDFVQIPTVNGNPMDAAGGVTDHGNLTGLADDDHTQYHNNTRGDVRYYQKSEIPEIVQDVVSAFITAGAGIAVAYDDALNTFTISATGSGGSGGDAEYILDTVAGNLSGQGLIVVGYDDPTGVITITTTATANSTDGVLKDRANHTGAQTISTVTGLQAALDTLTTNANGRIPAFADPNADRIVVWDDSAGAWVPASVDSTISWSAANVLSVRLGSETQTGLLELATAAETTTGTDNTRAVHPAGLKVELDKKAPAVHTHTTAQVTGLDTALTGKAAVAHSHVSTDTTDFAEAVRDTVGTTLVGGAGVTVAVNDISDTITLSTSNAVGYIPVLESVVEFPIGTAFDPAISSAFYNGRFEIWPRGDSVAIAAGDDGWTAGGWIGASHEGPAVIASKNHPIKGGLKSVMSFTSATQFHYIRQLVPSAIAFNRGIYTLIAEVENLQTVAVDVYVQSRLNADDELGRERAVDTAQYTLAPGRRWIACAFSVEDLYDNTQTWDERSMMETAMRFVSTTAGTVTAIVHSMALIPGRVARGPIYSHPATDNNSIEAYYETGYATANGYTATSGQKRVAVFYKTKKALNVVSSDITITDLAGNVGKISTYDLAGVRTDNVDYTAVQGDATVGDSFRNGFSVVKNSTTATGIGFTWIVDNY